MRAKQLLTTGGRTPLGSGSHPMSSSTASTTCSCSLPSSVSLSGLKSTTKALSTVFEGEAGGGRGSGGTGSKTPVKRAPSSTLDAECKKRKKCDDVFVYELSDGSDEASRDSVAGGCGDPGGGGEGRGGEEVDMRGGSGIDLDTDAGGADARSSASGARSAGEPANSAADGMCSAIALEVSDGDGGMEGLKKDEGQGKDASGEEDDEMEIIGVEGQFVLMDCAHSRDTCVTFPFVGDKTKACDNCWCFVCEEPWKKCSTWHLHCHACYADPKWRRERDDLRNRRKDAAGGAEASAGVAGEAKEVQLDARQQQVCSTQLSDMMIL